ncbi:MAG TPA: leucyl aminopeptidase [Candidatus Saccharimonadales bacterium]|nr:leucyl aminopeptidase [Candidatus Saccharimonadales bacterium]
MKVEIVKQSEITKLDTEVLVLGVFVGEKLADDKNVKLVDKLTGGTLVRFLTKNKKFGKPFESTAFHIPTKAHKKIEKVILLGLGEADRLDATRLRQVAGFAGKNKGKDVGSVAVILPEGLMLVEKIETLIVGFLEGNFNPGHHQTEDKHVLDFEKLVFVTNEGAKGLQSKIDKALVIADSIHKVREIVNQPANVATPEYLVSFAKKIARDGNLKIEVFSEKQVIDMGMGIMASVARGSEEDLYFVVMRYLGAGSKGPTLALVGKGITFDSGGISIKPSESMEWMKMDMAGAAACFGAIEVISKLKPKINVVVACPLTENLPSGKATKPGDVVKGLSGKTVEVINTDAEGRLVLSDALSYVSKNFKPDYIVDVATLTGAAVVALGSVASAALGKPQKFVDDVISAGEATGERLWQLPLYDEYRDMLKSYIADIANVSSTRGAGTETGAKFLEEFIDKKQAWVHLDIAPTAWEEGEKPYIAKGSTAFALTTMVELALKLSK